MNENLKLHRSEPTGDAAEPWDGERWLAGAAAGACLFEAARRRSTAGLCLALAGGALAWWAATGLQSRRSMRAMLEPGARDRQRANDLVDEASRASFPASDPLSVASPAGGAD
jgi:hypothetical protein